MLFIDGVSRQADRLSVCGKETIMRYFDLHCDTLVACLQDKKSLLKNDLHVSVEKGDKYAPYIQCAAIFLPDSVRGAAAEKWFDDHADLFEKEAQSGAFTVIRTGADIEEMENKQGTGMILTVEGSAVLNGKLENVAHLRNRGVRMMTLTWNGSNEVGSGIMSKDSFGLTPFGVLAVKEMERLGIAVDISHASEKLFFDVAEHSTRPFVASHSNAKALCKHPRNLSDEQIKIMCQRDCLVGLNYFKAFLNDEPDKADVEDLYRHAEHFLSLGGANILAMGSDFDGASMPTGITGLESMEDVANVFLRHNLPEALVNKIFFENAAEFFKCFDK